MEYCNFWKIAFIIITSMFLITKTQFVKKAPPFFSAFTCTLGYKNPSATGPYTCPTPNVIPRSDKYGLSSSEISKSPSTENMFWASAAPGSITNTTNFLVSLTVITNDNIYFGFIIVVITIQPENSWVDLFQHSLRNDSSNTLTPGQGTIRNQVQIYAISAYTFFSNTNNLNYALFISSYAIGTTADISPAIQFTASTLSLPYVSVKVEIQAYVDLAEFEGFVLVYNTNNMAADGAVINYDLQTLTGTQLWDFQAKYPDWGARFNSKCIIGYYYISFNKPQDITMLFKYSVQSNYNGLKNVGLNTTNTVFRATIFCLSDGSYECDQTTPFYDSLTQGCYIAALCPLPTSDPGIVPTSPQLCILCNDIDCIDCAAIDRSYCLQCNSTLHAVASFGVCECDIGYYRPSTLCVPNCTYYMEGCKEANCTNETCCTQCDVGYHLYVVSSCFQCKSCDLSISNCSECSSATLCTVCQSEYYLNAINATNSVCISCNSTITYCQTCTHTNSGTNCDTCYTGYIKSLTPPITCTCNTINLNGCASCNIPTQCVACRPAFYVHPSTNQCNLCTTLFQCLTCIAYNHCTSCNQYYAPFYNSTNNSNLCVSCSTLIAHCVDCSSSSFCTECDIGYGVTLTGTCQSCSTLHPHCTLCTDYQVCVECEVNSYTFFLNSTCITCSEVVSSCLTCSPVGYELICSQCQTEYFLDPASQICNLCSDYIDDCKNCQYNMTTLKPECTECTQLFLVDSNLKCQKCKQGNYVTRTCSNATGCSSSHLINNQLQCLSCDASAFFQYDVSTKQCVCQIGFEFEKNSQICNQVCGDGLTINMACDDGNKINGDGCSDQCHIEDKFECTTSSTGLSSCILNDEISIVYDYTLRHMGENKLSMYFTVSPSYTALNKVDWKKAINFNFSESIKSSFSYQDGTLIVTIEYNTDLDDKQMDLLIQFDPSIIKSDSVSLSFKMGAVNGPLTYETDSDMINYKIFNTSGLVVGISCLLFYLISSYFHKIIGLQTIQLIQLIYFVRLISGNGISSSYYAFNTLKYANGYNDIFSTSSNSIEDFKSIPAAFIRLNLKLLFLQNCNLMLAPAALASMAYVFYSVKKSKSRALYNETKEKIHKDLMVIQNRKVEWIYDSLIFSFTLSLLYLIMFSMILYDLSITQPNSLHSSFFITVSYGVSVIILFVISGIYCFEVITGLKKYIEMNEGTNVKSEEKGLEYDANGVDHGLHPLYVPIYLLYQLILIVMLSLIVFVKFNFLIETILGFAGIYLGVIWFWKPYKLRIHNNAIILHQSIIILFILLQLFSKYKILAANIAGYFLYVILAFILFALILQLIRLFVQRKLNNNKDRKQKQNQSQEGQNQQVKKLFLNPYSFQKEMMEEEIQKSQPKFDYFSHQEILLKISKLGLSNKKMSRMAQNYKDKQKNEQILPDKSIKYQFEQLYEIQLKKQKLRQQLNVYFESPTMKNSTFN